MERSGLNRTGLAAAYIKDGLDEIAHMVEPTVIEVTSNIVANTRYYDMPSNLIKLKDIRVKNHDNDEDKYRSVPRIMYEPPEEDADGV